MAAAKKKRSAKDLAFDFMVGALRTPGTGTAFASDVTQQVGAPALRSFIGEAQEKVGSRLRDAALKATLPYRESAAEAIDSKYREFVQENPSPGNYLYDESELHDPSPEEAREDIDDEWRRFANMYKRAEWEHGDEAVGGDSRAYPQFLTPSESLANRQSLDELRALKEENAQLKAKLAPPPPEPILSARTQDMDERAEQTAAAPMPLPPPRPPEPEPRWTGLTDEEFRRGWE